MWSYLIYWLNIHKTLYLIAMYAMRLSLVFDVLIFKIWFGCTGSLLLHWGWFLVAVCRGYSLAGGAWASHCGGFPCFRAQALDTQVQQLCGSQALLPCSVWNLPRPGIEPMSSALAGRFLTTGPPGKSLMYSFSWCFYLWPRYICSLSNYIK